MKKPSVDDSVRLTHDIPELELRRGEVGVVRSLWFYPTVAYEVEFRPFGVAHTRALLLTEQFTLEETAELQPA